jgi:hypothetical protein
MTTRPTAGWIIRTANRGLFEKEEIWMIARIVMSICLCAMLATGSLPDQTEIELRRDDDSGRLHVSIDDQVIFVYQYNNRVDIPHYFPMNSPSGKNMLVEQTEPYPHHQAFWFADTRVRLLRAETPGQPKRKSFYPEKG